MCIGHLTFITKEFNVIVLSLYLVYIRSALTFER